MYDYLIVGAGLFGAVFANEATKRGKKCLVIEKRNHIAGNIYTEDIEGICVHTYGPHIFHTKNKKVWDYVNNLVEFNHYVNCPVAFYKDEVYNMPFNMNTFSRLWGIKTPQQAKEIIQKQIEEAGIVEPKNLEEQAISMVGKDIYQKLVKGYTEKQWGRDCKELPSFIIKRLPVRFTYDNNYFDDPYQGVPKGGYTQIVEKLLEGIDIELNADYFDNKAKWDGMAKQIVYTGMLDKLFDYCYGHLQYRSLRFETKVLDTDNFQGNAVVNYTEREVPYTRIAEHKHFDFGKQPKTVVTYEYPATWTEGAEPFYSVNDDVNEPIAQKYKALAKEKNIILGGRLGDYRYYNMDAVIERALAVVDEYVK